MRRLYQSAETGMIHAFPAPLTGAQQAINNLIRLNKLPFGSNLETVIRHGNFEMDGHANQVGEDHPEYEDGDWFWDAAPEAGPPQDDIYVPVGPGNWEPGGLPPGHPLSLESAGNPENPEHDFPQRYRETFVLAGSKSGKIKDSVMYIHGSGGHGADHTVVYSPDENTSKTSNIPYSDFEIRKGIPHNGYVNSDMGYPIFFSRMAERQWKRGVCESTFDVYNPCRGDKDTIKQVFKGTAYILKSAENMKNPMHLIHAPGAFPFHMSNMRKLFTPKYPTYFEAFETIYKGERYGTAFSNSLCIMASPHTSNLIFAHGGVAIGEVMENDPKTILVKEPLLYQEVLDLVRRHKLDNVKVTKA